MFFTCYVTLSPWGAQAVQRPQRGDGEQAVGGSVVGGGEAAWNAGALSEVQLSRAVFCSVCLKAPGLGYFKFPLSEICGFESLHKAPGLPCS